jgi:hypothetical protein
MHILRRSRERNAVRRQNLPTEESLRRRLAALVTASIVLPYGRLSNASTISCLDEVCTAPVDVAVRRSYCRRILARNVVGFRADLLLAPTASGTKEKSCRTLCRRARWASPVSPINPLLGCAKKGTVS